MPQIPLSRIRLDQRAQPRTKLDTEVTAEYAEAMKGGTVFPPVRVFCDRQDYWLADGFHRHYAATAAGIQDIACFVENGGLREAILYSCKANSTHGLRRSDEDKRRAVRALLQDDEWGKWSDRQIARQCDVSHPFVGRIREEVAPVHLETLPDRTRIAARSDGAPYEVKTANIGRRSSPANASEGARVSPGKNSQRSSSDVPEHHAAMTVLARSIAEIRATPQEIVSGCIDDDEERDDLRDACAGAAEKLTQVLREIQSEGVVA